MKLTLASNKEQPVIRVDNFKAGSPVYGSIEFTPEDLRQLNAFAATCPMFGAVPVRFKAGDVVNHKTVDFWPGTRIIESVNDTDFPEDPVAIFVGGGFWRTSSLVRAK